MLRTVAQWLELAKAAPSEGEAESMVRAAADQATAFGEWAEIFEAVAAPRSTPGMVIRARTTIFADAALGPELVARAIAAAEAQEAVWGYRNAALFQNGVLADPAGARATLAAAERMMDARTRAGRAQGFEWGVLAGGVCEAFADATETQRLLERGWDLAWADRDVENLGRVVVQWAKLLDRNEGVARMHRVEAAASEWGDLGGTIYWWWQGFGDAEAGMRVRRTVLEQSTKFEDVSRLIQFWHLYDPKSPGIEEAFARAESLARADHEWYELAQLAYSKLKNSELPRRALERAAAAAESPEMKSVIAAAFVDWLDDTAAAERVGPRGVRPESLRPRLNPLEGWPASAHDLFDLLRARMTKASLTNIASADYGYDQKHYDALQWICESGLVPFQLSWHPGEVLELTRWSRGANVDHVERAFACTLLCLASEQDLTNVLPGLIDSCLVLGPDFVEAGERLVVWHFETLEDDVPEAALALLALFLLRGATVPSDPRLAALLARLVATPADAAALRQLVAESIAADVWTEIFARVLPPLRAARKDLLSALDALQLDA